MPPVVNLMKSPFVVLFNELKDKPYTFLTLLTLSLGLTYVYVEKAQAEDLQEFKAEVQNKLILIIN